MLKLDWTHKSMACPSLGNILGHATASEYILNQLNVDICVQVTEYYLDFWKIYLPLDRINIKCYNVKTIKANEELVIKKDFAWFDSFIYLAGFEYKEKIKPRQCFISDRASKQVLLYPREYDNKNRFFTMEYWVRACSRIREQGYKIGVILDNSISHRDGSVSEAWAYEFITRINPDKVYPNTLFGLQSGIVESSVAVGRGNGPAIFMLKSDIRQILLDAEDEHMPRYNARRTFSKVSKPITVVYGHSLDWTFEL